VSIRLRIRAYQELAETRGHRTYEAQAAAAGLGIATIHRLRAGQPAGARAVAALCRTYGVEFDDLFVVSSDEAVPA
jgi:hypothetical protein